jgi:hypothetical protein
MEQERHFLDEFVEGLKASGKYESESKPGVPWYNRHGDCVMYLSVDEGVVADRIDEYLTLYRSAVDERVIGFQLKGIKALMGEFDYDLAKVEAEIEQDEVRKVTMNLMFLKSIIKRPTTRKRLMGYAEAISSVPALEGDLV